MRFLFGEATHLLSRGHCDYVIVIATECPSHEFKVLGHAVHSQALYVAALRKRTPEVFQAGEYLGENKRSDAVNVYKTY